MQDERDEEQEQDKNTDWGGRKRAAFEQEEEQQQQLLQHNCFLLLEGVKSLLAQRKPLPECNDPPGLLETPPSAQA